MVTELVMVRVAGIVTNGMMFMNLYCPDTVTVIRSPATRLLTVAVETPVVRSAHGDGEVAETRVLSRHEVGHGCRERRVLIVVLGVVGQGVAAAFAGGVVEHVPVHQQPAILENAEDKHYQRNHDQGGLNRRAHPTSLAAKLSDDHDSCLLWAVASEPYWAGRYGAIVNGESTMDAQSTVT